MALVSMRKLWYGCSEGKEHSQVQGDNGDEKTLIILKLAER